MGAASATKGDFEIRKLRFKAILNVDFIFKVDWDKEIDEELEKQKKKKKSGVTTNSLGSLPSSVGAITKSNPVTIKNTLPAPISKPRVSNLDEIWDHNSI
jgi:hypothetical protein